MIWHDFKKQNYATMFAEEQSMTCTFNWRMNGFKNIPTDHYMRPFWVATEQFNLTNTNISRHCLPGTPRHVYLLNYTRQFMKSYQGIPKFAISFVTGLSHEGNNPVQYADEDMANMLKDLNQAHVLDDTVLIVMGDHGLLFGGVRETVQGKLEERLPMMSFVFPQKFRNKYPDNMRHLVTNVDRLSTPFDLHETLQDILNPERLKDEPNLGSRGLEKIITRLYHGIICLKQVLTYAISGDGHLRFCGLLPARNLNHGRR